MPRPKKIQHVGLHANRLAVECDNPREVAFAKRWKEENDGGAGGNTLAWLLVKQHRDPLSPVIYKTEQLAPYDQQSASIAATVVQWLGSNVGFCFLRESLGECGYAIVEKNGHKR